MANTFNFNGHVMNISAVDTNWLSTTHFDGSPRIKSVGFFPAAQNDRCILRAGSTTGPIIYDSGPASAAIAVPVPQFMLEEKMDIVLVAADGTYNAAAVVIIILDKTS